MVDSDTACTHPFTQDQYARRLRGEHLHMRRRHTGEFLPIVFVAWNQRIIFAKRPIWRVIRHVIAIFEILNKTSQT